MASEIILRIEIVDDTCSSDEVHVHRLPLDTYKPDIITAVCTLYPTATSILILVDDPEEDF